MSGVDTWILAANLLSKPQEQRCREEIKVILPWFRQRSQLFTNLEDDSLCDIVKNVKLSKVRKDFVITRQGEIGDCFYIILKGSVSVYAKKEEESENYFTGHAESTLDNQYVKNIKERITRFGTELIQFKNGRTFGELVFLGDRKERSATVIADEATELISVDEQLYRRCLHAYDTLWKEKYSFVQTSPLFASWGNAYKSLLAESLTPIKVNFWSFLAKQGQPCNSLFFVSKGLATVVVDQSLSSKQYSHLKPKESIKKGTKKNCEEESDMEENELRPLTVIERRRRRNALGYAAMESRLRLREQNVATIGVNAVIGDIEFILDLSTYSASIVCAESLEVYELDKQSFHRIIAKKNFETLEYMRGMVMAKLQARCERLARTPLYSWLFEYAKFKLKEPFKDSTKKTKFRRRATTYQQAAVRTSGLKSAVKKTGNKTAFASIVKRVQTTTKERSTAKTRTEDSTGVTATAGSLGEDGRRTSDQRDKRSRKQPEPQKPKQYTPEEFRTLKKKMQAQGKMIIRSQDF